ncbi:MAG: hypothetical protein ACOYN6_10770 [Ignavibacteria bacterium]
MRKVFISGLLSLLIIINFACQYENIVEPSKDTNQQSVDNNNTYYTKVNLQIYQNHKPVCQTIVDYTKTGGLWFSDTWHDFNTSNYSNSTFDVYCSFEWYNVGTEDPFWGEFAINGNSYISYTIDNNMQNSGFADAWHYNVDLSPNTSYQYKAWVESLSEKNKMVNN